MTHPVPTAEQKRQAFAAGRADGLAQLAGTDPSSRIGPADGRSERFVWYADDSSLTLVVGEQEDSDTDLALAVGLGERGDRDLRLVLPRGWHDPTLHRWAWLADLPIEVWSHDWQHDTDGSPPKQEGRPTRDQTQQLVRSVDKPQLHLGDRTSWIEGLLRWAGSKDDLDASHRQDTRAWQCRGQRVLRVRRAQGGLEILAGIDWGANSAQPSPQALMITGPLTAAEETTCRALVEAGINERLDVAGAAHHADEHWLQAVLRRHPRSLGLEQPVLREVAAWRPRGSLKHTKDSQQRQTGTISRSPARGRGFVDLAGLDAAGNLLIVETKLGADHMLVLQGLDYKIWAEANRARLSARLDCRPDLPIEISYCVGGKNGSAPTRSAHPQAQLAALAPDIRWHVQEVTDWTGDDPRARRGALRTFPLPPQG